jgi:DNA-binding NtrC family response regulator
VKKSAVGAFVEKGPGVSAKPRKPMDITEVDFVKAMEHSLFEVAAVADELGVSRQSIYRRIDASARFRRASEIPMQDIQTTLASCGGSLGKAAFNLEVSASGLRQRLRSLGTPA